MQNCNSKLKIKQSRKYTSGVAGWSVRESHDSPDGEGNSKHTLVLGVSSSIAAYKVIDLIRILKKKRLEVYVIMTEHTTQMISPLEFEKASGNKVYIKLFPPRFNYKNVLKERRVEHIEIARKADLFAIVPATANIVGKIASGIADDFLTTTILATNAPVFICPSMNTNMWNNPIIRENIEKLKRLGYCLLLPESGQLACGKIGIGRLPDIKVIAEEISRLLKDKNKLKGKKIIVTAGGTQEPIDAVRLITNKASGKMGAAVAEECYFQGAEVLLLKAVTAASFNVRQDTSGVASIQGFSRGGGIRIEVFETARNLENLIKKYVKDYDVIFHTAAVSDFVPEKKVESKIDSFLPFNLKLHPTPKILDQIKSWSPKILLIGFKAVYKEKEEDLIKIGLKKLKASQSNYIIVNDVGKEGIGFGADDNEVYVISPQGLVAKVNKAPKREVARKILEYIF